MLWRKPPRNIAKVGVEGSNPFARSSLAPTNFSPPNYGLAERPRARRFCALGLGFANRNDTRILSLNGGLSPGLGGLPDLVYKLLCQRYQPINLIA
jgi:hypothetical protein